MNWTNLDHIWFRGHTNVPIVDLIAQNIAARDRFDPLANGTCASVPVLDIATVWTVADRDDDEIMSKSTERLMSWPPLLGAIFLVGVLVVAAVMQIF